MTRKEAHNATEGASEQHVKLLRFQRHADGSWSATYKLTGTIVLPDGLELRFRRRFNAKGRTVTKRKRGRVPLASG